MNIGNLVLRLRDKTTTFTNRVGGAIDYAIAKNQTLSGDYAFILPVLEIADRNEYDSGINQNLIERFSVVVAVRNDTNHMDKTGFLAYNRLNDVRQELFEAFLGLDVASIDDSVAFSSSSLIYFYQGQLLDIDRSYIWYQYTFEYQVTLEAQAIELPTDYLDTIHTQWEMAPSENLPISEDLPVQSFDPDVEEDLDLEDLRNS